LQTDDQSPATKERSKPNSRFSARVWTVAAAAIGVLLGGCALWAWPESAVLVDSAPSGAEVLLDGHLAGQTPLRLASRPWPLRGKLEVSHSGYQTWSNILDTNLGETRVVDLPLEPLPGSLSINTTPTNAQVIVDGRERGQTPLALADVPPGRYKLELALSGYQMWQTLLEVAPGGSVEHNIELAPLRATPEPRSAEDAIKEADDHPRADQPGSGQQAAPPALDRPLSRYPLAVLIENAHLARPQSGLGSADIVYEALAEGGISRFMAVYVDGEAPAVGPVRSARHYFVDLAAELGASVVHVGGSPLSYISLTWHGLRSLDETFGQGGFWRSRGRPAPHNTYISVPAAREVLERRGPAAEGSWGGFTFKDPDRRYASSPAQHVSLDYQPWGYRVDYRYDADKDRYLRSMAGAPHTDAENGSQLETSNVAVLRVDAWVIDNVGRLDMAQIGVGPAVYFIDGVVMEGNWHKQSTSAPTQFLDAAGNAIRFNPGPIWVQLVPGDGRLSYE
jgi:hypothetical protein